MKYFFGAIFTFALFFGIGYFITISKSNPVNAYLGKCFSPANTDFEFLNKSKFKVDAIRPDGTLNIRVNFVPQPANAIEIMLAARVNEFDNSFAKVEEITKLVEVPCEAN